MRKDLDRNEAPKLAKFAKFLFILISHMWLVSAINSNFNTQKEDIRRDFMILTISGGF